MLQPSKSERMNIQIIAVVMKMYKEVVSLKWQDDLK